MITKSRKVPPLVCIQPAASQAVDPSLPVDIAFFESNPGQREYVRDLIPGEAPAALPPGTRVRVVIDHLGRRWRGFEPPAEGLN